MKNTFLKSPIFYNKNITIGKKHVFHKTLHNKGIRFVNDLVNENGKFLQLSGNQDTYGKSFELFGISRNNRFSKILFNKVKYENNKKIRKPIHTKSYPNLPPAKIRGASNV